MSTFHSMLLLSTSYMNTEFPDSGGDLAVGANAHSSPGSDPCKVLNLSLDLDAESPATLRNALNVARASRDTARSQKHSAKDMIAKYQMLIAHLIHCTQHLDAVHQDMDLQIARLQAFMSTQGIPLVDLGGNGMVYSALHGFTLCTESDYHREFEQQSLFLLARRVRLPSCISFDFIFKIQNSKFKLSYVSRFPARHRIFFYQFDTALWQRCSILYSGAAGGIKIKFKTDRTSIMRPRTVHGLADILPQTHGKEAEGQ
ncbi:hypothetical protein FIBSPDRAFT_979722 [Athelia psychrophila]|uniref:Uncharacterized protein n=1 Tax=Athelia psychrophila TaxID=1759441 RepID=A0A166DI93_9AGAM|nr:hypothetical protein FIBSPDRAFT_979722 [Fibularhizoctonia sp. CBS 109695]